MKQQAPKHPRRLKAVASNIPARVHGKFRVVIVDENPLCRRGLRELLREDRRFEVVAEADHGETGLKTILEQKPDVAVLDAVLPSISGLEIASLLRVREPGINTVILAQQKDEKLFNKAISLGIKGYVL